MWRVRCVGIFLLNACVLGFVGCQKTFTHKAGFLKPFNYDVGKDHARRESLKFLVFGDAGTGDQNQERVASAMWQVCAPDGQTNSCDFALVLGDNIYQHGVSGYNDPNFNTKFEKPYRKFQSFDFWLVPGNHDWQQEGSVQNEINRTGASDRWRMPFNHYSIPRLPQWLHVYGLDTTVIYDADYHSEETPLDGSERARRLNNARVQLETARAALQNKPPGWIFLFGHHPVYSTGKHGAEDNNQGSIPAIRSAIVDQLFCDSGIEIDVYFAGHEHLQEHLKKPYSSVCDGTFHQVVQGAGGKLTPSKNRVNGFATQKKLINELGFALVSVSRTRLEVDFYGYNEQRDSWGKRYDFMESREEPAQ